LGAGKVIRVVWRYVVASLLAGALTIGAIRQLMGVYRVFITTPLLRMPVTGLIYCFMYLVTVVLLFRGMAPLQDVANVLRTMVARDRASKGPRPVTSTDGNVALISESGRASVAVPESLN